MSTVAHVSFHTITDIKAIDHGAFGRPLLIELSSRHSDIHLTLFFNDEELSKRLAEAINEVMAARREELERGEEPPPAAGCAMERAAYEAMEQSFSKWSGL